MSELLDRAGGLARRITERHAALACVAALRGMGIGYRLRPLLPRFNGQRAAGAARVPRDFDATLQFATRDGAHRFWARFAGGRLSSGAGRAADPDVSVTFRDAGLMLDFFSPEGAAKTLDALVDGSIAFQGNLIVLARFGFIASAFSLGRTPQERPADRPWPTDTAASWQQLPVRRAGEPCADPAAAGAPRLPDPYLAHLTLDDFPRLKRGLHAHLHTRPRICTERARLWTEGALRERGGAAPAVLRQARTFAHVLRNKRALLAAEELIPGTTTSHPVGVIVFPELGGTAIWPELLTMQARALNPYEISAEDARILDQQVFPHWVHDNIREWARARFGDPEALRLDEKWVLYFMWKNHAVSHTIADLPAVLARGLRDLAAEAARREAEAQQADRRAFFAATRLCLDAVVAYAARLGDEAAAQAAQARDEQRRAELLELARICRKVPAAPAETLHEALCAIWISFLSLHQESMNAGLSIGRLDLWLQPYLERELDALEDPAARERWIRRAVELVGALMLKCTDHLPLVADVGNRLFAGSSSDQVITLGGVRPDGSSAVCEMTYVLLKATELLGLRDPNVNARYSPGVNPELYLRRLCEVNQITGATPSIHNDAAMIPALVEQGFALADARDWGATGCVEPTSCGRHMGHTNCMMFNLVAPLEMTLHRGVHPLVGEPLGPDTGDPRRFASYEEFAAAYERQLGALIDRSVEANDFLGRAHQALHPTPFLSALVQGTFAAGRDVIDGGARYNTSGTAMIGLSDVVDSLAAIKTLVFERRSATIAEILAALAANFVGHEALLAQIEHRVPKFGSDDELPAAIARRLIDFVFERFQRHRSYRGGRYLPGYWSMSNHVVFGLLSGALPSGRRAHKPFTPGLTPSPLAGASLLEEIRQVAALDARKVPNNIAFNVKLAPGGADTHAQTLDRLTAYAKSYIELGGLQLQYNVVRTETLRHAMEHPEQHRNLLVRISGYNAYFVELNRDMQLELVERLEHA